MKSLQDAIGIPFARLDRSDRLRMDFSGAKAVDTLNGLLSNDITKLAPGTGCYAAALTNKGKVIADVRVFARDGSFLVDTGPAAAPGFMAMIRKYVNPRLAAYRDVSQALAATCVLGISRTEELAALDFYSHVPLTDTGGIAVRVPDFGVDATEMIAPREVLEALVGSYRTLDPALADALRIEAGRPLWGVDMDENTLAQEAALDRADIGAISFNKGCYTGQETVARVHFRGHVNRVLRGLRASAPLASGSTLHGPDGAQIGDVRSVALSPRLGAIALAYVRREIEDGATVLVKSPGGEKGATVVALPFA